MLPPDDSWIMSAANFRRHISQPSSTPWITGGCRNWYVDERSGRLTLLWPGTVTAFRERLAQADGSEFVSPLQREVA